MPTRSTSKTGATRAEVDRAGEHAQNLSRAAGFRVIWSKAMRFEGFLGVVAAAGLCQGCLFPSFDSLTQCEQGCGGAMSVTSSTGTGGGAGGAGGDGGNGGNGGSGGGTGGEGGAPLDPCADPIGGSAHGVLITPLGGYSPFCIDSVEVSFERYKTFLLEIQSVDQADYDALLGLECAGTPRTLDQAGLLHHYAVQQAYEDPFYMHDALPVIGASWCEARIYCRQAGKDLCGHVDGVADDPPDGNFSRWVAACSNNGEYTYSYMSDDPDASKCKVSDCPTGYVHLDDAAPNACEGGVPGLYNMSGNSSEWVDNCVAAGGPGFDDDDCFPRGGSCPMGTDYTYCEYGGMAHNRVSGFEYVGFRCCWDAP